MARSSRRSEDNEAKETSTTAVTLRELPSVPRTCLLCSERIRKNEPFNTALVFLDDKTGHVANVPYHLFCFVDVIADTVNDEDEDEDEAEDETEGRRKRPAPLEDAVRAHLKQLLNEYL